MRGRVTRCAWLSLGLLIPGWCVAVPVAADERAQLAAQRQQIEVRADQAMAACSTRFDVVGCQEDARRERSAALAPLQRREMELADMDRKERSERQQLRVRDKQRDAALVDAQQQMAPPAVSAPAASAAPRPRAQGSRPDAEAVELQRQQQARRAAQRAEQQRLRSQEQRRQIEQRQADKAKRRSADKSESSGKAKPVAGLPVPSAAAVAALRASAPASSAPRP